MVRPSHHHRSPPPSPPAPAAERVLAAGGSGDPASRSAPSAPRGPAAPEGRGDPKERSTPQRPATHGPAAAPVGPSAAEGPGAAEGVEAVVSMLRARGGRVTATRRATIDVLLGGGDHRHLSADDVAAEVRERLPDVAESTIYRTLTALEELGVVTHVHLGHGPSTFHLADQGHRHLVCQGCGSVTEVPADEFTTLARRLEVAYGFSMSSEHFAIIGRCRDCRAVGGHSGE